MPLVELPFVSWHPRPQKPGTVNMVLFRVSPHASALLLLDGTCIPAHLGRIRWQTQSLPGQGELKAICNNWGAQILPKTLTLSQRCDVGTPTPSVKQTKKLYLSCTHSSRFLGTSNFPPSLENQWGTGKEALMERHKQVKIWWVWFYIFFLGIPYINLK